MGLKSRAKTKIDDKRPGISAMLTPLHPSRENLGVLGHQHPALWHPAPCNIRGACLGKYWGLKGIMYESGLTSMILNDEYFAIFL